MKKGKELSVKKAAEIGAIVFFARKNVYNHGLQLALVLAAENNIDITPKHILSFAKEIFGKKDSAVVELQRQCDVLETQHGRLLARIQKLYDSIDKESTKTK